ncbi:MAG: polysaccharide deacetylase family protein, partial [Chloroflexi bacterium]|nr:polysaccharide deacetylase family protein [Chloroflexota bacterium]
MAVFGKQASAAAISRILQAKVLLIGGLIIMVLSLAFGTYFVMTRSTATHSIPVTRSTTTTVTQTQPTVTSSNYQAEVTAVGKQYMNALLQQKYDVMWSMLHPQVQAQWSDEQAFASYLKAHFQGYTLQSFSTRSVSQLSFWVNPETMVQYNTVQLMPISLQLKSQLPPQQQAQLAPQFQQPSTIFQNLPFIVQFDPSSATGANDHWLILSGGPADPESPILPPTTYVYNAIKVPILMYHYISEVPANDPNPVLRRSLSVSPQVFNQQLDYLKQQGFHSITFNQLMNALYYGAPLPSKPIIFTFDDGYLDAYTTAYPALKAHGFSGMFYIITGKVGWQGQMSWGQMREMLANGMQMGSHT